MTPKEKEEVRDILLFLFALVILTTVIMGIVEADEKGKGDPNYCKAESVFMLLNVPYRVGCELGLKRW